MSEPGTPHACMRLNNKPKHPQHPKKNTYYTSITHHSFQTCMLCSHRTIGAQLQWRDHGECRAGQAHPSARMCFAVDYLNTERKIRCKMHAHSPIRQQAEVGSRLVQNQPCLLLTNHSVNSTSLMALVSFNADTISSGFGPCGVAAARATLGKSPPASLEARQRAMRCALALLD